MSFSKVQSDLTLDCTVNRAFPDMQKWAPMIRQVKPDEAIYVIFHNYNTADTLEHERDAYLLEPGDINWPGQQNDPIVRSIYPHKTRHDSNTWMLKDVYRTESTILRKLVINKSIYIEQ